jgi:hypothetical protein
MAHRRLLVDRVLVTAWRTPEVDDTRIIAAELTEGHARLGRPLLYLSLIGLDSLPRGEVRDDVVELYQGMLAHAESMHIVIEGAGFQQSFKKSVIANVLLVVPASGRVFIENSLQEVIAASPPPTRVELARAAQAAAEQKLFDFARVSTAP